jgi:hypothetical protein
MVGDADIWTATEATRHFYAMFWAATERPQTVTVRGVPRYVFRPGSASMAKKMKAERVVIVRAIRSRKKQ